MPNESQLGQVYRNPLSWGDRIRFAAVPPTGQFAGSGSMGFSRGTCMFIQYIRDAKKRNPRLIAQVGAVSWGQS